MTKHRSPKSRKAIATATFSLMAIAIASPTFAISSSSPETWQLKSPIDRTQIRRVPASSQLNPIIRTSPRSTPSPTPPPPPAPPVRYRVKMWFKIDNANDGIADNTIECYGSLRINGDLYWNIPREHSDRNQREAGQELQVSDSPYSPRQFIFDRPTINYDISLRDSDGGSPDDDVHKAAGTLNLELIAGSANHMQITQYRSRTWESSRLFIYVERI